MWQNEPNPSAQTTTIRYFVPESAASAQIKFFTATGQEIHSLVLNRKGAGQVTLSSQQFASGMYVYHLYVDGQSVDNKKLVIEK